MDRGEELMSRIAAEILYATDDLVDGRRIEDELPSAPDLARKFNVRLDAVKKKLRVLREAGLIHPVTFSPKRYRFDRFALNHLPEENELHRLFFNEESPYYIH